MSPVETKRGLTLLELLMTISIIAVVSTIVFFSLASVRKRSRDSKRISDISAVIKAFQNAETEGASLINGSGTCVGTGGPYRLRYCTFRPGLTESSFDLSRLQDPSPSAVVACTAASTAPCEYSIQGATAGVAPTVSSYRLYFFIEASGGQVGQGARMATPAGIN